LLMSTDRSAPTEPIVLQDGDASLGNACPPIRARTKTLRGRILMRAIWPACAGVRGPVGPVRLWARIDGGLRVPARPAADSTKPHVAIHRPSVRVR
jgi:hypothetical protein